MTFTFNTMEAVENETITTQVTRTDLSDWSGAPVVRGDTNLDTLFQSEDRTEPDYMDFAKRGYDLFQEGYGFSVLNYGPASAPLSLFHIVELIKGSQTIQNMFRYFEGIAWDSLEFRITSSNPKGLAGGYVTGVFPFAIWNTESFLSQAAFYDQNNMTRQHLMLAPQSQLVTYGEAQDVVFDVPWQYNVPYLPREFFDTYQDGAATNQLWPGTPVLFFNSLKATYVSSQSLPAQIRVFVKFNNLRFTGPVYQAQSGVETLAPIAAAAIIDGVTTIGSEILSDNVNSVTGNNQDEHNPGSYENPQAVQLAYVGDSTRYGPPPTTPIFRGWGPPTTKHAIMDYIKQPQYVLTTDTNSSTGSFYANPTAVSNVNDISGQDQLCTYLRYFSQCVSYWRGSLIFDFVIMGHPFVEVGYNFQMFYPPFSFGVNNNYSQNSILKGICSGVYRISVPMPYMTPLDHMAIIDYKNANLTDIREHSTSGVVYGFNVISTALDVTPNIPIAVFIRAGDDFQYLQPYAIGLGFVENNSITFLPAPSPAKLDLSGMESQVGLPDSTIVFQTRANSQLSTSQMLALEHVEDFMNIWSRCLPFSDYDNNDEPIVDVRSGVSPYWYPQVSTDASHTLDVNNSWWVTNDFVSFYSSMFLYFRGSIGYKILCVPGTGYKYLTISSGDELRQPGHNPFTYVPEQLPPHANFGYGTVATDLGGQPVLEATIPLRSNLQWAFANPAQMTHVIGGFYKKIVLSGDLLTNVVLHIPSDHLQDAMYRKIGRDFTLAVRTLLPPPTLWMAKGYDWS